MILNNKVVNYKVVEHIEKKLDPRWLDSLRVFRLKKKIFSRRSRKPLTPAPPLHSNTAASWDKPATDLCFGVG
jgi:hypothetical protein